MGTKEGWAKSLAGQHADLERQIEVMQRAPAPDSLQIRNLKREKLKIKEQMACID